MEERKTQGLQKNIYAMGAVSLFTDVSSEMIYPLIPDLLASFGSAPLWLGAIEGVAEATASALKAVSGILSDRLGRRKSLIFAGYGLSALSKPLFALATAAWAVLLIRFLDRVGKGVRTAPRDALISDSCAPGQTGKAFGIHRSMDTLGAVLGPILAFVLLERMGVPLPKLFYAASIPAALGIGVILFLVREIAPPKCAEGGPRPSLAGASPVFRRFVAVSAVLALGHFPAAFYILRCRESGWELSDTMIIYLGFNLVWVVTAYPAGRISDSVGRRRTLILAYFLFAAVLAAGAWVSSQYWVVGVFMSYGLFMGIHDGAHRAFAADLEPPERRASAFGALHAAIGIAALPAGLLAGALWETLGAPYAFGFSSVCALAAGVLMITLIPAAPGPLSPS